MNYLYETKKELIFDDEKYFGLSCDEIPENSGFNTDNIEKCLDVIKFKGKNKFPTKVLVWVAFSAKGVSQPLIVPCKSVSISQHIYLTECLQKRLLPFIQKHHQDNNYVFWPDLATSYFAKSCFDWMSKNIPFLWNSMNPPNVPQARPIENFWGDLAQKVYNDGWQAQTEKELVTRMENC